MRRRNSSRIDSRSVGASSCGRLLGDRRIAAGGWQRRRRLDARGRRIVLRRVGYDGQRFVTGFDVDDFRSRRQFTELCEVLGFLATPACLLRTPARLRSSLLRTPQSLALRPGLGLEVRLALTLFLRFDNLDRFAGVDALGVVAGFGAVLGTAHERRLQQERIVEEFLDRSRRRLFGARTEQSGNTQKKRNSQRFHGPGTIKCPLNG